MAGPLSGIQIIEFAGLGPGPFCGMMLADHGADVVRIDRLAPGGLMGAPEGEFLNRSRKGLSVDLKNPDGIALVRRLCGSADALIEGFRPGVMERLGLGPDVLIGENPALVYGRMTGWGQDGPYASMAGHDINYIALSGALHATGRAGERPTPALNLIGDFGGGGMMLAFGLLSALLHSRSTGKGQVVDCAMTEGSAVLMTMIYSMFAAGRWRDARGANLLDTGSHFYDSYETSDGKYVAVGPVEPQFYRELIERMGLSDDGDFDDQNDAARWPMLKQKMVARFREKSRDEWCALLEGTDACFTPVMPLAEAPTHPHNLAREAFVAVAGTIQPAPAPRYSETRTSRPTPMQSGPGTAAAILASIGIDGAECDRLRDARVIG
jgi:alpha-methylacyl-CoA racemase